MVKNDKEEMIINAALAVFCKKGYANTRMADIAREAGVSYGLVYHYFGSKKVLFDIIVNTWWSDLYHVLEEQKNSKAAFPERLAYITQFFLDAYANKPNLTSIFISEISRSSVYHTSTGLEKFRRFFTLCEAIMDEGQKTGFLRDDIRPHYLTYIFLGAVEGFISILVLGREQLNDKRKKRMIDGITQVFLDGARVR
ncbi:MAG: TetR/AcrR family transcriptional regulator [Deltaproteobacteria bacterium]|nr:TetR/AcrR family transcriptional regulator [Deltaproteobacteria bacterium]